MPNPKKPRTPCLNCGKEPRYSSYKYCSNMCQREFEYLEYIKDWKAGKATGLRSTGVVLNPIKKYLRLKFRDKCCLCGWKSVNPKTGKTECIKSSEFLL